MSRNRVIRPRSAAGAAVAAAAALVLLFAAGCASNPATGKQQLNFYSEAEEIAIGREADAQITTAMGLVDDPALQAYVDNLGRSLAAKSERPGLPWSFKVIDDPVVNAFALPGGYIYVTRGILAHMGSEAELASVLGHEIGHVTAQHGVNQMSKQQLAMGGLLVSAILVPEVADAAGLAQAGLGLLFLKYGRDDERQADDLGLRYMTQGGFDAGEMPKMFTVLEGVSQIASAGRIPNWLASHPEPAARRERTAQLIAERRYAPGQVNAEGLLAQVDGLTFGHDPRQGFFVDSTFYHPGLAFQLEVPTGWRALNERERVVAVHPEGVAQLELRVTDQASADEAARAFLAQQGVTSISSRRTKVNGLSAVRADFSVANQQRALSGRATFVAHGGRVFRWMGLVYSDRAVAAAQAFEKSLASFKALKDKSKLGAEAQVVRVVELPQAMTFEEFLRRYPSDVDARQMALMNRIDDPTRQLPAGTKLKRIEGRKAGEQTAGPAPQ
ncbi:MAG: peptidase M48 [Acidobacteriota bacterium]